MQHEYGRGGDYRAVRRPPSSRTAVAGIVAGVTGLGLLVLSAGIRFEFGIAFGLLALVCSRAAKRRMDGGEPGRPGQVRTALVLGVVGVALSAVAAVTWAVLSAGGFTPDDFLAWLERQQEQLSRR